MMTNTNTAAADHAVAVECATAGNQLFLAGEYLAAAGQFEEAYFCAKATDRELAEQSADAAALALELACWI